MDEFDWKALAARLTEALDEMMDRYAELLHSELSKIPNDTRWTASEAVLKEARAALTAVLTPFQDPGDGGVGDTGGRGDGAK